MHINKKEGTTVKENLEISKPCHMFTFITSLDKIHDNTIHYKNLQDITSVDVQQIKSSPIISYSFLHWTCLWDHNVNPAAVPHFWGP